MSLWDNEDSERQQTTQRILIIFGAVAAVLIIFWVFRNAISIVGRPGNGVGFSSSGRARKLINGIETEGNAPIQYAPALNPGSPKGSPSRYVAPAPAAPAYIPPPPPPLVAGAYAPTTIIAPNLPDLSAEERAAAKAATAPLKQTLAALHDFDRKSVWNNNAGSSNAGSDRSDSIEETENAVDALGAMVALYGHPERFPEPMRGTASAAATEMRSYLRLTMDAATSGDPAQRQRIRPDAAKRLANADAAVQKLEGANPRGGLAPGIAAN